MKTFAFAVFVIFENGYGGKQFLFNSKAKALQKFNEWKRERFHSLYVEQGLFDEEGNGIGTGRFYTVASL